MSAARERLDHVVLPRRVPGLALLERYFPSPAANLLDAELNAFARPGDTVLDPWAGTGWTARRAIAHGMRSVSADASPFAQLAARALLQAPDASAIDAALSQIAASRRVDVPLAQHLEELYATRCPACRSPVVADQYIWPRSGDAPARKVYRCETCDISVGGPPERSAPVDEVDLAKLGIEHGQPAEDPDAAAGEEDEELPPAPVGLTDDPAAPLGEAGGPPPPPALAPDPPQRAPANDPRWASTVRPSAPAVPTGDAAEVHHIQALRERFPVLDGRGELVDELLGLYTPRNLYAIAAIANKIDAELRNEAMAALFRLALAACLLPASRLNGYPGRVASLRIAGGHVRQPASRHQREVNVWRLFVDAVRDVRVAVAALGHERRPARFAADLEELGGVGAANVLWIRCRPAVVGQYLPPDSVDMVLGSAGAPASIDELSFEYLATAWLMGREAAGTLRLEPLFGSASLHADGVEPAALRRAMTSAAGALKADGWCNVLLEGDDPERLLAVAVAGAAAGLDLVDVIHRESRRNGDGVTVHFRKPIAGESRLRDAATPLRLGADHDQLTYPELAGAMQRAVVALLRDRGEPAGLTRITAAVLLELARAGLLRRLALQRSGDRDDETDGPDRLDGSGHAILAQLLREELWRDDHPALVRIDAEARPTWWLREPSLAETPLADRVEWATFSVLTTAGRLDEQGFMDRIYGLFPGLSAPDEELVRACLAAYARIGERGELRTEEELAARMADHARTLATAVDVGHRLGMRVWLSKREQARPWNGGTLGGLLHDDERRAYLPLIVRAPAEALGEVDAIWYVRGRFAFLLEVEWTAMLGDPVLRRGRAISPADDQVRLLLLPAERGELLRGKLERSPWLRAELERQNWHILKWQHLDTLAGREAIKLEWLEPLLGLDPLIERGGEQLTMFGE
ncbi:MAG TPA: hypothetical protein VFQ81_04085 [Candidatus Limnocylindria bacterium]|nr:hypothetical protein [Candidatus Limnocylindria bacterium]